MFPIGRLSPNKTSFFFLYFPLSLSYFHLLSRATILISFSFSKIGFIGSKSVYFSIVAGNLGNLKQELLFLGILDVME